MLLNRKAQSTLEYALIIAAVAGALVAVNMYLKKGVQGRLKESSDEIGKQFDPKTFETSWRKKSTGSTTTTEERMAGTQGTTSSTVVSTENVVRSEYDTFGNATIQHDFK